MSVLVFVVAAAVLCLEGFQGSKHLFKGIDHTTCDTEDGGTIKLFETFDDGSFRMQCLLDDGWKTVSYATIGCLTRDVEGNTVFHPLGHKFSRKTMPVKGHEGLSIEIMGNCEDGEKMIRCIPVDSCKLYKNKEVILEIQFGCSKAIQLDGSEQMFHCGSKQSGPKNIGVNAKQEGEKEECIKRSKG